MSADGTKATAVWTRSDSSNTVQSVSATITGSTATWSSPAVDLSAPGQNASFPQVALSADGTKATAIWRRSDGSNAVQSASATLTGSTATWSTVTDLSAPGQAASNLQVALSADGTKATAVWLRRDGSNDIVQTVSATITGSTATWSTVTNLSAPGQNATGAQVAVSADGTKATAIWPRSNGSNRIVQSVSATITGSTATWSTVTDLSEPGQNASFPQVALSADGTKATAVWRRSDSDFNPIVQSASATIPRSPGAPAGVTATPGDQQVTLSWNAPDSDGGSAITSYTVTGTPAATCTTTGATSCVITGLINGTQYTFNVVATNAVGDGPASASVTATPATPVTPPGAPAGVTATPGDQQVTLSWNAPDSDGGSAITSYTVTGTPAATCTTTGATSCVITGLINGTQYTFNVVATNAVGDGPASASVTATPATPVTPPTPTDEATRVGTPSDGQLPRTGSTAGALITLAGALCAAGYAMYASSRRRIRRS